MNVSAGAGLPWGVWVEEFKDCPGSVAALTSTAIFYDVEGIKQSQTQHRLYNPLVVIKFLLRTRESKTENFANEQQ